MLFYFQQRQLTSTMLMEQSQFIFQLLGDSTFFKYIYQSKTCVKVKYIGDRCIMLSLDVSSVVHLWVKEEKSVRIIKVHKFSSKKERKKKYEPSTHTKKKINLQDQQDVSVGNSTCHQVIPDSHGRKKELRTNYCQNVYWYPHDLWN